MIANDDADDWSDEGPIDDGLMVWPSCDLDYVVYLDPDHQPVPDVEEIERQVLAEIAPLHRFVRFEPLSRETLRHWSPFPTRAVEEAFLACGFGRGLVAGVFVPYGPAALRRRRDYLAYQQAQIESLQALRCVAYATRSALIAVRKLVPRRTRDVWLHKRLEDLLTPVCGKPSLAGGDKDASEIPLTMHDDLIVACNDFSARDRRVLHLSVSTTPNTAERLGRRDMRAWCGHHGDLINAQIQRELGDPERYFGQTFDRCAAALWLCQNVMELRLASAEADLQLQSNNPVTPARSTVFRRERKQMRRRVWRDYKRTSRRYRDPKIVPVAPSLRRRLLTVFYGGMSLPFEDGFEQEYGALEHLARWLGALRREGTATMDGSLERDLCDIEDETLLDLHHLLATPEWASGRHLLTNFLPKAGWQALRTAAERILDGAHASFEVTYRFADGAGIAVAGHVHREEARVAIVGPFLMLPLNEAALWQERSRGLRQRGLQLVDAD